MSDSSQNKNGDWLMCQIPFPLGDRDIFVTHSNVEIRANLQKHVSADVRWFIYEQSKERNDDWSIDDLEEYLASQNYTVLPTVRIPAIN